MRQRPEELLRLVQRITVGGVEPIGDLAIVWLVGDDGPDAELLEEGLAARHTLVREVSDAGTVNRIDISHRGPSLLLLLDGEEVAGAKQNRVFNASFLIPPSGNVSIPVSCVERGRWAGTERTFVASQTTASAPLRTMMLCNVSRSIHESDTYDADQGSVWDEVDRELSHRGAVSPTAALADARRVDRPRIDELVGKITTPRRAVGVAAVRRGAVTSIDVLACHRVFRRAWPKLARGLLEDLSTDPPTRTSDASAAVDSRIRGLLDVEVSRRTAPGIGDTLHAEWRNGALGGVSLGGFVYHLHVAAKLEAGDDRNRERAHPSEAQK